MRELGVVRAGGAGEIVLLDQRDLQPAQRRIERVKANINDDAFIAATTAAFRSAGPRRERRA